MKKISAILLLSALIIAVGTSVAYYNTSSFGYDNANIFYIDENNIQVFYFNLNIKEAKKKIEYVKEKMPDRYITI